MRTLVQCASKKLTIRGYLVIQQNLSKEEWRKCAKSARGGICKGVAIILSPEFAKAFYKAGEKITTLPKSHRFSDRILGINLTFDAIKPNGSKLKGKQTRLFLASIYHPWEEELYEDFNEIVTDVFSQVPEQCTKIIGHDLNASVGCRQPSDVDSTVGVLGPYGLNNRNKKGISALSFLENNNLRVMTSFFEHKEYGTHLVEFNKTSITLDSISVSAKSFSRVKDCKVWNKGVIGDHSAILLPFAFTSIKVKIPNTFSVGEIDWHKIQNDECTNKAFNQTLKDLCSQKPSSTNFNEMIIKAGFATANTPKKQRIGLFENDCVNMQPLVDEKAKLLHLYRNEKDSNKLLIEIKQDLKIASKNVKDRTEIAKGIWANSIADRMNTLNMDPKEAWKAAYQLKDGENGHHKKMISKKFRNSDGNIARTKQENINNVEKHFTSVFNTHHPVKFEAMENIKQRDTLDEIGLPPSWQEFTRAMSQN